MICQDYIQYQVKCTADMIIKAKRTDVIMQDHYHCSLYKKLAIYSSVEMQSGCTERRLGNCVRQSCIGVKLSLVSH
jgi:hypothetical protein